ncbi:MAG: gamma-glutamyl-gamma-aminobutyrate hydrolase family protein [Erysipelotrichaceae bacterium]|nr:gamma-glutamyl-gamma-aminobutyrate hydrolase family protein [Erysipelotrichaceae bacterium]
MNIAILTRYTEKPNGRLIARRYTITAEFQNMARKAGFNLIPIIPGSDFHDILAITDGLIIPGSGTDVDPKHYGKKLDPHTELDPYDLYAADYPVIKAYREAGKKLLGICAGHQELNVFLGGTLTQHIENHFMPGERHPVTINKDSTLYKMYGKDRLDVSSTHHQCIDQIAPDVKIIAMSDDGIIEGFETEGILSVQWHPEAMNDPVIFKMFF